LIGISTQFGEPYRIISFATGLIMIPLSFVWSYMENGLKTKQRRERERIVKEQIERMKVKCSKCGQTVIPRKLGEAFICPNCNHQFKSTKQIIEEWKKGIEVAYDALDLLNSL